MQANPAFAQDAINLKNPDNLGLVSIGAALAIGLAALGGGGRSGDEQFGLPDRA